MSFLPVLWKWKAKENEFCQGVGGYFQIHFWMQPSVCPPFSQSYLHLAKMSQAKLLFSHHSFPSTASWHCLELGNVGMWVSMVSGQQEELLRDNENLIRDSLRKGGLLAWAAYGYQVAIVGFYGGVFGCTI